MIKHKNLYKMVSSYFERNWILISIWIIVVFMSSLITIYQGSIILLDFYRSHFAEKEILYEKLAKAVPGISVEQFYELFGKPLIVKSSNDKKLKEYIFSNEYFYMQLIEEVGGSILSVAITTKRDDFQPVFNKYFIWEGNKKSSDSIYPEIILNKMNFSEVIPTNELQLQATRCNLVVASSRLSYSEEFYLANPGNYQSIILASNDAGKQFNAEAYSLLFDLYNINDEITCKDIPDTFRANEPINTIMITAPGITANDLKDFTQGVYIGDIRVLEEVAVEY